MSTNSSIEERIEAAADAVGSVWPLHSFVTANPLAGFEDQPFHEAVNGAEQVIGGDGYPSIDVFRNAWEAGRIAPDVLKRELITHGYDADPEASLDRMAANESFTDPEQTETAINWVDAVLTKWLAAFLDQGQAEWSMPNREQGFYAAFHTVAPHDSDIPNNDTFRGLPNRPLEAIQNTLEGYPADEWQPIFEFHLTSLPGWAGFIKRREVDADEWQTTYPITLPGYLAARLALADCFDAPLAPADVPSSGESNDDPDEQSVPLPEVWLTAWEATYREELVESITEASVPTAGSNGSDRPDAQLVFCIDTRSEIIRRHIEATGNYETHGYAGFFGVPMRYAKYNSDVTVDACPPILDAQHRITDRSTTTSDKQNEYDRWHSTLASSKATIKSLKSNAATAFSFVENTGVGYAAALTVRTLLPQQVYDFFDLTDKRVPDDHEFCTPSVDHTPDPAGELPTGLTLDEKVEYAATAFDLMGWEQFARVVVFAGHASQTANNPFDSSLDCGACAGNPGGPNARVLATICNDNAVKTALRDRGIDVPEDTVFVAGEHNTTTDSVELYASDVPETHREDIEQLREDLETARAGAATERARNMGVDDSPGIRETQRRAADWAETRPEWGLAGNAGFVIGPRTLTAGLDLDGRSFLHSYDWKTDSDGNALEAIMAGPMIVTQWINTQYYFATVDNAVYGSGSKVTHNPVGNVGVYQGNGGDLMSGLPLQSLMSADDEPYHQPIRLSAVIHAPVERVTDILSEHEELTELLDNNWLSLTVVDPQQKDCAFHYDSDLTWDPATERAETNSVVSSPPSVADD